MSVPPVEVKAAKAIEIAQVRLRPANAVVVSLYKIPVTLPPERALT